ncbi:MAG: protein kinase [Thermoanaerobaculia bacterium]
MDHGLYNRLRLLIGQTLSHFKITAKLGEGGMGVVYRAEDTKLGREVAIKVLPEAVAGSQERLARFEREAKVLASLNHPNIAAIHQVEEADGVHFLVMELAPGETLADRLHRGPIPFDDAVPIALQIAEALESAHEQGVIHRDLKPANLKVAADGQIKVLDFGLAKALAAEASSAVPTSGTGSESMSPTLTAQMTQAGTLLGTAAYMSPEQAKGLEADRRADVWAFGVVLWEMLTGRCLFEGETTSEVLAAVLRDPIDGVALPPETPATVRALLARCLDRNLKSRLRDIGEARIALEALSTGGEISPLLSGSGQLQTDADQQTKPPRLSWLLAALATIAALLFGILWIQKGGLGPSDSDLQRLETELLPPDGTTFDPDGGMALSPDGRMMAFVIVGESAEREIWIRPLDSTTSRFLEGTEGARYPFWSPDSRNLGFFASGSLKRVAATGGPVQTIAPATNARGGTWCASDQIVYSPNLSRGLAVVPATGGEPTDLTQLDAERGEFQHRFPSCLPSGDHVLMLTQTAEGGSREDESHIDVVSLETGARQEILRANSSMAYSPSGYLLFWREGSLMAVPFDSRTLKSTGEAQLVAQGVAYTDNEYAMYSISQTGLLVYQVDDPASARSRLLTVDVTGEALGEPSPEDIHYYVVVSHDGKRAAYEASDFSSLWVRDLVRGTTSRFTHEDGDHLSAVWSPDDEWLLFGTDRENTWQIYRRHASGLGSDELLYESPLRMIPVDWSPDGEYLTVDVLEPDADEHIALFTFEDQSLEVLIDSPFLDIEGRIAPDGRWLAYTSTETGRFEVYVVPFLGKGDKYQVSTEGGNGPEWDPKGEKLFYLSLSGDLMSVDVDLDDRPTIGVPRKLFSIRRPPRAGRPFSVLPDGESFVINQLTVSKTPDHMILVQNWLSRLAK